MTGQDNGTNRTINDQLSPFCWRYRSFSLQVAGKQNRDVPLTECGIRLKTWRSSLRPLPFMELELNSIVATCQPGSPIMASSNIRDNSNTLPHNCDTALTDGAPLLPVIQYNSLQMIENRQRSVLIDSLIKQLERAEAVAAEARKKLQPFLE